MGAAASRNALFTLPTSYNMGAFPIRRPQAYSRDYPRVEQGATYKDAPDRALYDTQLLPYMPSSVNSMTPVEDLISPWDPQTLNVSALALRRTPSGLVHGDQDAQRTMAPPNICYGFSGQARTPGDSPPFFSAASPVPEDVQGVERIPDILESNRVNGGTGIPETSEPAVGTFPLDPKVGGTWAIEDTTPMDNAQSPIPAVGARAFSSNPGAETKRQCFLHPQDLFDVPTIPSNGNIPSPLSISSSAGFTEQGSLGSLDGDLQAEIGSHYTSAPVSEVFRDDGLSYSSFCSHDTDETGGAGDSTSTFVNGIPFAHANSPEERECGPLDFHLPESDQLLAPTELCN